MPLVSWPINSPCTSAQTPGTLGELYTAFGLWIDSEVPCPELTRAESAPAAPAHADVSIRLGRVPERLSDPLVDGTHWQARSDATLLQLEEWAGARFLIRNGNEIIVDALPGRDAAAMRVFLLGSAMGILLMQRGQIPLHANAVVIDGVAVAIAGPIGAGKSTLTSELHSLGYAFLADDVSAVQLVDGIPYVAPGYPRIKLWTDSVAHLGIDSAVLPRIRSDIDKFNVALQKDVCTTPAPLASLFLLTEADVPAVSVSPPLTGMQKLMAVQEHFYKVPFHIAHRLWPQLFEHFNQLLNHISVYHLARPRGVASRRQLAECLVANSVGPSSAQGDTHAI